MHEYPFVRSVIETVSASAVENRAVRVKAIRLVVGDGSGYVPESIQMYFDMLSKGTVCEGAEIIVRRVKPVMRCESCGREFEREPFSFDCPVCGGLGSPTETGKELYIDEMEIITDEGEGTDAGNDTGAGDAADTGRERPPGRGDAREA